MPILKHADFEVPGYREFVSPPTGVPGYAAAVLALGPVAYWRLGEPAGTTLADQAGTHPLTLTGGYTLDQPGALATDDDPALHLNPGAASSSAAVLPTGAGDPFSLMFWVRVPGTITTDMAFIGQYASGQTGRTLITLLNDGRVRYTAVGDVSFLTSPVVGTAWRLLVLTRAADGTADWYVDGQPDTQAGSHDTAIHDTAFQIGKITSQDPDLLLDEVAVFDFDLSADQVRWLHGLATGRLALPPGM